MNKKNFNEKKPEKYEIEIWNRSEWRKKAQPTDQQSYKTQAVKTEEI